MSILSCQYVSVPLTIEVCHGTIHHIMRFRTLLICLWIIGCSTATLYGADYDTCIQTAAFRYKLNPNLIRAIIQVESGGNPHAVNVNDNGTRDLGLMQINSSWLPTLAQFGISEEHLRTNSCVNIMVGSWILAQNIREHGYTWKAIGRYNAVSESKMLAYAHKVYHAYNRIIRR